MTKTSLSGSAKFTYGSQVRPALSTQLAPSNCTISAVAGCAVPRWSVNGGGRPPPAATMSRCRAAVRLPLWKPAA
ncbi:hypothetical protein WME99_50635 [Sorangium sp. So ce136]|uniref:hypothetical protein n=1 Tax=Sorangium sp. So ce136 TaxID=3133284 RepID=UPI003F0765B7